LHGLSAIETNTIAPNNTMEDTMRLLIALLLPWLLFFTIGRSIAGITRIILQRTVIGWVPAAIRAVYALSQYKTDQKIADLRSSV